MIRVVAFDLDGTLVDAYPAVVDSVNATLRHLGLRPRSFRAIVRAVGWGDRQLLAHFVGETLADRAVRFYRPHHAAALNTKGLVRFLPGARSLLAALGKQGIKTAIVTNRPSRFVRLILEGLGVRSVFAAVLCADRTGFPKPAGDMLHLLADRLRLPLEDMLYVGDMTIDVQCGQSAGVRTVAVTTGSSSRAALKALHPHHLITTIADVQRIINEGDSMGKRMRKGKLNWRSKKANHGTKPGKG